MIHLNFVPDFNIRELLTIFLLKFEHPFNPCPAEPGYTCTLCLQTVHCLSFSSWIYINNWDQAIWLAENWKRAWHLNLFNKTRAKNLGICDPKFWTYFCIIELLTTQLNFVHPFDYLHVGISDVCKRCLPCGKLCRPWSNYSRSILVWVNIVCLAYLSKLI